MRVVRCGGKAARQHQAEGGSVADLAAHLDPAEQLPAFDSDEGMISQILRNFISNALKFTERGSVRVTATLDGATYRFDVADTGIGIAPENLQLIFEEFSQIEHPLQRISKGTGLGLPLCRKLASLLGGQVLVSSTQGVGSVFTLELPRSHPASAAGNDGTNT